MISVMEEFLHKLTIHRNFDNTNSIDHVQNYALITSFLSILILQMKDTAAEAVGERNLINQKIFFCVFNSLDSYSCYPTKMFTSIAQIECNAAPQSPEEHK